MARDDHNQANPIIREFHPLVDGSKGRPTGFVITWGNRVSPVISFAQCDGLIWEVSFGKTVVQIAGRVFYQKDTRGDILSVELYRLDGGGFRDSFRVHYVHAASAFDNGLADWGV